MKKNWLAVLSLVLNVVLLVSVIRLGGKLERMERNLRDAIERAEDHIHTSIDHIERNVENAIEETTKLVADYTAAPAGIHPEGRSLVIQLELELRRWSPDTSVELHTFMGEAWTYAFLSGENGVYRGCIEIPLQSSDTLRLMASITSGGMTTREELGSWGDISMMLPVQMSGFGGSVPRYRDGMVQLDQYQADLYDGQDQYGIRVNEPAFRLYVNDVLVQEQPGEERADGTFVQYECSVEPTACKPGDTVRMAFACKDDFGLGYEFNLGSWNVSEGDEELEEQPIESGLHPTLTWE